MPGGRDHDHSEPVDMRPENNSRNQHEPSFVLGGLLVRYTDPLQPGPVVHFSHLQLGDHADVAAPTAEPQARVSTSVHAENVADATTTNQHVVDPNASLQSYVLHPKCVDGTPMLKGEELFQHMIMLRNRNWKPPRHQHVRPLPPLCCATGKQQRLCVLDPRYAGTGVAGS